MLGNRPKDKVFSFARANDGKVILPLDHWKWAVEEAVDGLRLSSVDQECFHSVLEIEAPTTFLYSRNYTLNGQKKSSHHEAMRKGAELGFQMLITKKPPVRGDKPQQGKLPPTPAETEQVLKYIGRFLGISPFGSHMGYGRFNLMSVNVVVPTL